MNPASHRLALLAVLILTAGIYAPLLGGFWLGDDLTNLYGAHRWAEHADWLALLHKQFFEGVSEGGGFFRPGIILSLYANYLVAGTHYWGWWLPNLLAHLANGILIWCLLRRLSEHAVAHLRPADGVYVSRWHLGATALFLLSPFSAEAVAWVSARSDLWVTFFSLLGLLAWWGPGSTRRASALRIWALLPCLLSALMFKESAVLLPLQLGLLWLTTPRLRDFHRTLSLFFAFLLVAAFFGWRIWLFGHAFSVYAGDSLDTPLQRLAMGLASFPNWVHGLLGEHVLMGIGLLLMLPVLCLLGAWQTFQTRRGPRWLALALVCACGGVLLATFLNLGGLVASGEGGRLFYTPMAWAALAAGVAWSGQVKWRSVGSIVLFPLTVLLSAVLLWHHVSQVGSAQQHLRALVEGIPEALQTRPEPGLWLVPDHVGPIVVGRNGQGALVAPPLQSGDSLHRAIPSLEPDLPARFGQYRDGLLRQIALERQSIGAAAEATEEWPTWLGCLSLQSGKLVFAELPSSDPPNTPEAWVQGLNAKARELQCWFNVPDKAS